MIVVHMLFGLIAILWIYWIWQRRKFYLLMFKIPGAIGFPFIGMAHKLLDQQEILATLTYYESVYGKVIYTWIGPYPFLILAQPDIVQEILLSQNCVNKSLLYDVVDKSVGKGLFSLADPEWSTHRKLINPSFSHKVLLSFLPIFNREAKSLIAEIDSFVNAGPKDLSTNLQKCTLNIASQTTMGRQMIQGTSENNADSLLRSYQVVLHAIIQMVASPWLRFESIFQFHRNYIPYTVAKKQIRNFVQNLIQEKVEHFSTSSKKTVSASKNIFIDQAIALTASGHFTWKDVEDESNVLMLAAFETTANTVGNALMLLAMFPEYQEKVFQELSVLYPNHDDDFEVSYEDIQNMNYLDMVVNETMRVMAPVPFVGRTVVKEMQLSNGIVLPEGLQIAIDIFNLQRAEEFWGPEATKFNPDNFLPANAAGQHPYAFIPFTKGIRNCIGWRYALLSVRVILGKLLRKYRFTTQFRYEDLRFFGSVTIKLKTVPLLEVHRRSSESLLNPC